MSETKKTWSIATSPRNPYKLCDELKLLEGFEGQVWNKETQTKFAKKLEESDFFEGSVYQKEPSFSARDRINRSPKTFGFVRFDVNNKIKITEAGKQLLDGANLEELFLRQLLKWQYPSQKHHNDSYKEFNIKPFLEILRLAFELDGLSKKEIAIFCLPFIDYKNYENVKNAIKDFRRKLSDLKGVEKKKFVIETHTSYFKKIYESQISSGSIKLREQKNDRPDISKFIATKTRNSIDYSDAAIRYFRATGLFKLSATTFRLQIIDSKKIIVKEILDNMTREPASFKEGTDFLNYLGDPTSPALPDDKPEVLQAEVSQLIQTISSKNILDKKELDFYSQEKLVSASAIELKEIRTKLEKILANDAKEIQISAIQSYSLYEDIIKMYEKIVYRADYDIPDKPLFFEWNTWRAFVMLDDGDIRSNTLLDIEGKPLSTAPGGMPDGLAFYENFVLTIEVTLARGERQFEAENESVPRHLGKIAKSLKASNDLRPIFGIFIASGLNNATVAHFYSLRRTNISHYGGKAKIIPFDLAIFKQMLEVAKNNGGVKSEQLLAFLKWADEKADEVESEEDWRIAIENKVPDWINC